MSYSGYITTLKNVRPHSNADRLQLGDCFGNTVCVPLEYTEGMIGLYLPSDGQVSVEFGEQNNLLRKKDVNGKSTGGYLDPNKRNITAIKLRGERSDGIFLDLSCLEYTGVNLKELTVGTPITVVNGHEICCKYIPRSNKKSSNSKSNVKKRKKDNIAPLFTEHIDTAQLNYNLQDFKTGDEVEITLKIHGTSQRTGYLPVLDFYDDSAIALGRNYLVQLAQSLGFMKNTEPVVHDGEPIYDWGYVTGTRRVVLDSYEGGYYGSNAFRECHSKFFEGKLHKGETVYYEVCGFTHEGKPIMSECDNKKTGDKEFIKQYGKTTIFSYGCSPNGKERPQSNVYVYRMTMTNEDGDVVEYTPDFMRYRCEQMGAKCVPVFWRGIIPEGVDPGEFIKDIAEQYYDGADPIGKTHVREGVVARIVNRPTFTAYKTKNWFFKCLEGIAKASSEVPDMEEAQEVIE